MAGPPPFIASIHRPGDAGLNYPLGASDGSETLSSSPYDVVEVSLSEIGKFGCARSSQGHVKCWGYNAYGQLGHGNTSTASDGENEMGEDLAFVPLGANRTATSISVGENHACALSTTVA